LNLPTARWNFGVMQISVEIGNWKWDTWIELQQNPASCPLTWASKIQTEMALSNTEAEFIALSEGLHTIIPIINLMEEMHEQGVSIAKIQAEIK